MADKMLGIMVTKYENLEHIVGVVKAARASGHPVMIFITDEGVKFATNPEFLELLKVGGVEISVCGHSCERTGIPEQTEVISSYGSQYNNAVMLHDSTRVLIF
jgi:sulfur relay (sulfurtransferase) complex TusBCD TusD component (DsrE family)